MKNLFKDYGVFYGKYLELVKEHRRSVTFMSILAGTIASAVAFTPLIIDQIEDYKYHKAIDEFLKMKKERLIENEEES